MSYTYDSKGNLSTKTDLYGPTTYTYDYENRLRRITSLSTETAYTYDPFGRRDSKTVDGSTTNFL